MAVIPMGPFDQARVAPQTTPARVDLSGSTAAGRAITDAGQTMMDIAARGLANEADRRERENAEAAALARAKAANAVLDDEVQVQSVIESLQRETAEGTLDWRRAEEELQTRLSKLEAPQIEGLDPVGAEHFQGGLQRNRIAAQAKVKGLVDGARRTEFKTQFDTGLDTLGKLAGQPGADIDAINAKAEAFAALGRAAGVDEATVRARIQAFKDRNWTNHATQRLIGARDDLGALQTLKRDLTAEDGFYAARLDTEKRNALLSQIETAEARHEARIRAEADKREAAGKRVIEQVEQQLASGLPPPVEQVLVWQQTVKGTAYEDQFKLYQQVQAQAVDLLKKSPAEQRAVLAQLDAAQQSKGATVEQRRIYEGLRAASDARIRLLREQPLQHHAVTTGQDIRPLDLQAVVSGDVAKVQAQIAERMTILDAQRRRYGPEAGRAPLLPQEADMLAAAVDKAPPKRAVRLFATLRSAMGDDDAYAAAMQQIAPDSPVRALAGTFYLRQQGPKGEASRREYGDIPLKLLQGEKLLNPGKGAGAADGKGMGFPMPPEADMQAEVARLVGRAFEGRDEEYRAALQAVRAYYAATANEEGARDNVLDLKRLQQAVRAVIGEPAEIEGREVLPPWGMAPDEFEDRADEAIDARLKAAGLTNPGDVSLMAVPGREGAYMLVRGRQVLVDKRTDGGGRPLPLVIRIGGR